MQIKKIKVGNVYETKVGIGVCHRSGGTHQPSVRIEIAEPFRRGVLNVMPRDVLRELSLEETIAFKLRRENQSRG